MRLTYKELLESKGDEPIAYVELLSTQEWKDTVKEIRHKHNDTCQICKYKPSIPPIFAGETAYNGIYYLEEDTISLTKDKKGLDVHHKYYIVNKTPWEYKDALITVCRECHIDIHLNESIPVYLNDTKDEIYPAGKCDRCDGEGFIKEYDHYLNGMCFKCGGNKYIVPFEK